MDNYQEELPLEEKKNKKTKLHQLKHLKHHNPNVSSINVATQQKEAFSIKVMKMYQRKVTTKC